MATEVGIVNLALTMLGEERIMSLSDNIKPAREANAIFGDVRDALLGAYTWSFAKTRQALSALVSTPVFGYQLEYQLPSDCLRIIKVADHYVGVDLTDYRGYPVEEFTIEGRKILTDLPAPLQLQYVKRVTDTALFPPTFTMAFAAELAAKLCEPLAQSNTKRQLAENTRNMEISKAVRSNAIELPPQKLPDDEWLLSRL